MSKQSKQRKKDAAADSHIIDTSIPAVSPEYYDALSFILEEEYLAAEDAELKADYAAVERDAPLYAAAEAMVFEKKTPEEQAAFDAKNLQIVLTSEEAEEFNEAMNDLYGSPLLPSLSQDEKDLLTAKIHATQQLYLDFHINSSLDLIPADQKDAQKPGIIAAETERRDEEIATQVASLYGQTKDEYLAAKAQAENKDTGPKV